MPRPIPTRRLAAGAASLLAVGLIASSASAQNFTYSLAVSRAQAIGGAPASTFQRLGGFGAFNGQLYATVAQNGSANGLITVGTPGGGNFTPVVDGTQLAFSGIDASGFDLTDRIPTTPTGLLFADSLADQVYRYDVAADNISTVLTAAQIQAASGSTSSVLGSGQATLPNGDLLFFNGSSSGRSLLRTDGTTGNVSSFVSAAQFAASPTRAFVDSDLAAADVDYFARVGNTLYFGNNTADRVFSLDVTAADPASTIASVLSPTDIVGVTGFTTTGTNFAGFGSLVLGDDGKVYVYENRSRSILRFDPSNPAASLETVLSRAALEAGPAGSSQVSSLVPYNGDVYFYNVSASGGLFKITAVPEPGALALLGLGGLTLLRRRRA